MLNMINLIFKNGNFSFSEDIPNELHATEDVIIDVIDDVPAQFRNRLSEYACEFLNKKYNKTLKAYPGDYGSFINKTVSLVSKFNFRLSE